MKNKLLWIFAVIQLLLTIVSMQFLNETIPLHYDGYGTITRFGSKYETLIMSIFIILQCIIWDFMLKKLNKKYENEVSENIKNELRQTIKFVYICAIIVIFIFSIIQMFMLFSALNY